MYVPNFVPEPLQIPGNVAEAPYRRRLVFVRRASALHFLTVGVAAGFSFLPAPAVGPGPPLVLLVGCLTLLQGTRAVARGRAHENRLSALPFLGTLLAAGLLAREAERVGVPLWPAALGVAVTQGYSALCGRDYSFVGCGALSGILTTILTAAIAHRSGEPPVAAIIAGLVACVYVPYDLASLLSRRREGDEAGAVVDLWRDLLNGLGWVPRVIAHQRRHRIWGESPFGRLR